MHGTCFYYFNFPIPLPAYEFEDFDPDFYFTSVFRNLQSTIHQEIYQETYVEVLILHAF